MKPNKALKRLTKIEKLIVDVTERYSKGAHIREALQDAKAAVARAKEAVSLQASPGTPKSPPVKSSKPSEATPEPSKQKRKLSAAGRRAIQEAARRRWAQKKEPTAKKDRAPKKAIPARKKTTLKKATLITPIAKPAKNNAPFKKAAAKKTGPAPAPAPPPVQAATKPAAQVSMGI